MNERSDTACSDRAPAVSTVVASRERDGSARQGEIAPLRSRWPRYEVDEIEAVSQVLASGRVNGLIHAEQTGAFAREFAEFIGAGDGVCMANGTLTLEIALRALGVGPGDEVIVPARSFFATASCVLAVGAAPVFADIEPASQNIDPVSVDRMISPRTKAVICVHLAGLPCDMDGLQALCDANGLFLIEDCAQAHGATIAGRKVGSFGAAASFSFCTDKIMSTGGEGGMLLLRDESVWERAWSLKDHGKNYRKMSDGKGQPGQFRYIHDAVGTNARMTEMQAAIGRRQLSKLPGWLEARRRNAALLSDALAGHARLQLPMAPEGFGHAWYKFVLQLTPAGEPVEEERARIIARLLDMGIPCGSGSCPDMSRELALADLEIRRDGDLPVANEVGRRTIMFPVDQTLSGDDMLRMADSLLQALK